MRKIIKRFKYECFHDCKPNCPVTLDKFYVDKFKI